MQKEIVIFLCNNCIPHGSGIESQWTRDDVHVEVKMLPCSGKISVQYIFHALEGGKDGICIFACPPGECTLFQGNYRAYVRIENAKRLLAEIGLDPEAIRLVHFSKDGTKEELLGAIRHFIDEISQSEKKPEGMLMHTG